MKIGDKVAYSVKWLRSCGIYTGPIPFARGVVTGIARMGSRYDGTTIATVDWGDDEIPSKVNAANLVRVADLHKELS
jgi:hypothetical protein